MKYNRRSFLSATSIVAAGAAPAWTALSQIQSHAEERILPIADAAKPQTSPLCAVLMPFGRGKDAAGNKIDFDKIYEQMIAPAIRDAGFEPIRPEEQRTAEIADKQAFERILLCDFVIADVSDGSASIAYELGIRHALRPEGTAIVCAETVALPFYRAFADVMSYRVDDAGEPIDTTKYVVELKERLKTSDSTQDESPVFKFLDYLPRYEVDKLRTATFHMREAASIISSELLNTAVREGAGAVLAAAGDPAFANLAEMDPGVVVELFLSLRDVGAYAKMIEVYDRMPLALQRASFSREQLAFAFNRSGRLEDAARTLEAVVKDEPTNSTFGLLGRNYKDLWTAAKVARRPEASQFLRLAIEAYYDGFQLDWRDAYTGVNAVTLMDLQDTPDPRQSELLPVVRYAARQSAKNGADYWDHATLLELAVLSRDNADAGGRLADTVASAREKWELESTARNIQLIQESRRTRGEQTGWIAEIEDALNRATPVH